MLHKKKSKEEMIKRSLPKNIILKQSVRLLVLFILLLSVLVSNMTTDIFKVDPKYFPKNLNITEKKYNLFGKFFNLGKFITLIIISFIQRPGQKESLISVLFIFIIFLILFFFIRFLFISMIIYCIFGFCSEFLNIFVIFWIEQYGLFNYKTCFLSLLNLFESLGLSIGLFLHYYLDNYLTSFIIEAIILFLVIAFISSFNEIYFSKKILLYKTKVGKEKFVFFENDDFNEEESKNSLLNEDYSIFRKRKIDKSIEGQSNFSIIYNIFKNKYFYTGLLASTILTSSQLAYKIWIVEYFNDKLLVKNVTMLKKILIFIGITIVGPIGSFIFNFILSFIIFGGYYNKKSPFIMVIFYLLTTIIGNLTPKFQQQKISIPISIAFLLFSWSSIPYFKGIFLSERIKSKKRLEITILLFINFLFGEIPTPFIFDFISYKNEKNKNISLSYFMIYLILGLVFAILTIIFKITNHENEENEEDEEKKNAIEFNDINTQKNSDKNNNTN